MKSKNIKVIDEHNIDRSANVMFALELEGSEYVVYWIARDEESNNVFVSKVLKNIDGTYNMLNIDEEEKKKEIAEIVKTLISNSVSDQNDKLAGTTTTLANGKVVKFVNVSFNKEQQINVTKTYITTVKKEVTKVAESYYDVVVEEAKVEAVLPAAPVAPVDQPVQAVFPEVTTANVEVSAVSNTPIAPAVPEPVVPPTPTVVEPITVQQPAVVSAPVAETPTLIQPIPVVSPQPAPVVASQVVQPAPAVQQPAAPVAVEPTLVTPSPVVPEPVVSATPVVETPVVVQPSAVATPQVVPPVAEPATVVEPINQTLVFNAAKETNLNAALGEVANSTTIPVQNIESVREFGVESPAVAQPTVAPMVQPEVASNSKTLTKKAGFANSKFFMVVAIAFFLASCIFLGYEVYNYFQLVK